VQKLKKYYNNDIKGKKFAMWGLAFKPETDDIREAPALYIIDELLKEGATISVFDPEGMNNVKALIGNKINYGTTPYEILDGADALLIVTEWSLFRTPDFDQVSSLLKNKVIFDGRNLYDLQKMVDLGYYYNSIGRKIIS
jgi:UDPglucose 6-dehydrogenase